MARQIHKRLRLLKHKIAALDRGCEICLVFARDERVRISRLLMGQAMLLLLLRRTTLRNGVRIGWCSG
jgi:hypothetical protein